MDFINKKKQEPVFRNLRQSHFIFSAISQLATTIFPFFHTLL
jgi:hypothetical protein